MDARRLSAHFEDLADPRCAGKTEHRLIDVLVIAVCAIVSGGESWTDMEVYGRSKRDWLESFLPLAGGIPSHDTFRRVFMLIDPEAFEARFRAWTQSLGGGALVDGAPREVVAVDGKTVRRSFDHAAGRGPLHVVSAWASERGLMLGQRPVAGKSNEITAIPELLDALDVRGSIVTLDAMGCRGTIADRIIERGGDYLVALKANQGRMFQAVEAHARQACFARDAASLPMLDRFDDTHGRTVQRRVFACPEAATLEPLRDWSGLRTVLAVETIRSVKGSGVTKAEVRYFLSNCSDEPAVLADAIRRHWSFENSLHWVLDVTFRKDDSRIGDRVAVQNMALLRKIAINLVRSDKSSRDSLGARRKMAAWNDTCMMKILTNQFHA